MYNIHINSINFVWDESKNRKNEQKHSVFFQEAVTVFKDENAGDCFDFEHSLQEDRFILLGISEKFRVLVVVYCMKNDNTLRIISSRKATLQESKYYFSKEHL